MHNVRKSILVAGLSLGLGAVASAADLALPAKAPWAPPGGYSWAGLYIGASAGILRDSTGESWNYLDGYDERYSLAGTGFLGSVDAGYNLQSGNIVYGIEADIGLSTLRTKETETYYGGAYYDEKHTLDSLGTVRGRLGWAVDRALLYVTGGLAYGRLSHSGYDVDYPIYDFASSGWQTGWTAGVGGDYAITNTVSARVEALYVDLGKTNITDAEGDPISLHNTELVGRAGVNIKLW